MTIDEIVAEGDLVSYRVTETGTHKAEFLRIPATGRSATWTEIQFFRFRDGKVAEHWVDVDLFSCSHSWASSHEWVAKCRAVTRDASHLSRPW